MYVCMYLICGYRQNSGGERQGTVTVIIKVTVTVYLSKHVSYMHNQGHSHGTFIQMNVM
jgi:hypothetical protein